MDDQILGAWFVMAGIPELHIFEDFSTISLFDRSVESCALMDLLMWVLMTWSVTRHLCSPNLFDQQDVSYKYITHCIHKTVSNVRQTSKVTLINSSFTQKLINKKYYFIFTSLSYTDVVTVNEFLCGTCCCLPLSLVISWLICREHIHNPPM